VLRAFGTTDPPTQVDASESQCFVANGVIFKLTADVEEAEWMADLCAALVVRGTPVSRPRQATTGEWVIDGWQAFERERGLHSRNWSAILNATQALHAALRHVPEPRFLRRRQHRWAVADRIAWGDIEPAGLAPIVMDPLENLLAELPANTARSQLVHGDVAGNALGRSRRLPTLIDFSPYWRPPAYAEALIAVDAIRRFGASRDVLPVFKNVADFEEHFVRGVVFRLAALGVGLASGMTSLAVERPTLDLPIEIARSL
jgi:uncharacterized protein (TIGR02569 family)